MGAVKPVTVLQTLLTSYSEKQIDDMVEWATRIGFDQVRFKTFSLGSYTDDGQQAEHGHLVPKNPDLQRHQNEKVSLLCDVPLYQTVVFWEGDLGRCIDYDRMIKLPNVDKMASRLPISDEADAPVAMATPSSSRSARAALIPTQTTWASRSSSTNCAANGPSQPRTVWRRDRRHANDHHRRGLDSP